MKTKFKLLYLRVFMMFLGFGLTPIISLSAQVSLNKQWSIQKNDKKIYLIGQRIGIDSGETISVSLYGGVSFSPAPLEVDTNKELSIPHIIKIIGTDEEGKLIPENGSGVPVAEKFNPKANQLKSEIFTHAINVTWEFEKIGISFVVDKTKYSSQKIGAIIGFTRDGVKMLNIKKNKVLKKNKK